MFRLLRFLPRRWWSIQAWRNWRAYLHWRLETYGVYHPQGKVNKSVLRALLKQFPAYFRWLGQIDTIRKRGI